MKDLVKVTCKKDKWNDFKYLIDIKGFRYACPRYQHFLKVNRKYIIEYNNNTIVKLNQIK